MMKTMVEEVTPNEAAICLIELKHGLSLGFRPSEGAWFLVADDKAVRVSQQDALILATAAHRK